MLTPLGTRALYHYEREQVRRMSAGVGYEKEVRNVTTFPELYPLRTLCLELSRLTCRRRCVLHQLNIDFFVGIRIKPIGLQVDFCKNHS